MRQSTLRITLYILLMSQFGSGVSKKNSNGVKLKVRVCTARGTPRDKLDEYRIDKRTNTCHSILKGEKGPCGSNMLFYSQPNNTVYGNCDCKQESPRLLIFHGRSNQCYPIFSKGYCSTGKWLTLSRPSGKPICTRNPCRHLRNENDNVVLLDNKHCARLGAGSPKCKKGRVSFIHGKVLPRCLETIFPGTETTKPFFPTTSRPAGGGIFKPTNQLESCPLASLRSLSGNCQPHWEW